jgi:hypothetical protein
MGEPSVVNCYAEEVGAEQRTPVVLMPIPGQKAFGSYSDVACRGGIELPEVGAAYCLHGATLYKVTSSGSATALAGVVPGSKPAVMERGPERFMQSAVTISIASPGVVSWNNHRLRAGTPIQFSTNGTLPGGLTANTTYYVLSSGLTANSFRIGATAGGSAINTTGSQTGTHTATRTEATYQIVIVSDLATFCVEDDNISFVDLPEAANSATFIDNRWVYGTALRFYWSSLNDATAVDALSYATPEARPDGLVRAVAQGGELYLVGKETTEVWSGTDDPDQPWQKLGGTFISKGAGSRDSIADFDNALHWLGHDGIVYRGANYNADRVSTHAVERAIKAVSDKTAIRAFTYTDEGHAFYGLTCPEWTWVYDAATKLWAERRSKGRSDWRAWPFISAFGKVLVGDKASGAIRELTTAAYDEAGSEIRCELTLPDLPGKATYDSLEIDLARGAGLNVADDANFREPKVMLSWSDDGGYTYGSERVRSVGGKGDWKHPVKFTRLGMARTLRGRRFRIAMSDPVRRGFSLGDIERGAA